MRIRRVVLWLGAFAIPLGAALVVRAQSSGPPSGGPPQQFRSGVTLLRLDASVVDDSGRALGDLTGADFRVTVDGQPRLVVAAQFTGSTSSADGPHAIPAAPAPASYTVNRPSTRGRALTLVVDLTSIRAGAEAPLLDTAAKLVESLPQPDAVALVPIPGSSLDLTRDHLRVAQRIRMLRGTSDVPTFRHYLTFEEAGAFERGDRRVMAEAIERECARDVEAARQSAGLAPVCPADLEREARERLFFERRHVQTVLAALVSLAGQLRKVEAATSLIVISGGLPFEQDSMPQFQQLENALKSAGVSVYSVQVDQREADASAMTLAKGSVYSSRDRETGLANLATMVGGRFFPGVGRAQGVFDRMRTEITEAYELGVEAAPGDLDGKPHEVRVSTTRKASVHARRYVAVVPTASDPDARLANLLSQPVDVGDLPIAIASHVVRGDEPATLRVMIRGDIGHGVTTAAPINYRAVIIDADGNPAVNVTGHASSEGGVVLTTQLVPGRYRVRIAAVEAGGRSGTLEVPFVAGLRSAGGFQLADLIVATQLGQALAPSIYAISGAPLIPTLEITSPDPARFAQASVGFELRRAGSDEVVATAPGRVEQTTYDMQRVARGSIATAALAPGEYTLSAILKIDGQAAGRVSRTFVLETGSAPPIAAAAPSPAATAVDTPSPIRIADPLLDEVMHKVGAYVRSYGEQLSAVVGVEKYTQYVNPISMPSLRPVQITAEFALVKSGGAVPWTGYRDVVEVNGQSIHDRRDRIVKILTESRDPLAEASRLTAESARFNVGPVSRNFNVPTTALFFFNEANLSRFTFVRKGTKKVEGADTWEIAFKETARPTLITTRAGKDVPCDGLLWVLPADGTIVRTRLQVRGFSETLITSNAPGERNAEPPAPFGAGNAERTSPAPAPAPPPAPTSGSSAGTTPATASASSRTGGSADSGRASGPGDASASAINRAIAAFPEMTPTQLGSTADIEVTYRREAKLGLWLPALMTEEYQGAIPRINAPAIAALARSKATYSDYKQFGTSSTVIGVKK